MGAHHQPGLPLEHRRSRNKLLLGLSLLSGHAAWVLVLGGLLFPAGAMAQSTDPVWVPGSSQKVCQPNGEIDYETKQPTVSQTQTNYGLAGDDLGASFEHNGKLWFLFGDSTPTATFKGKPNAQSDPPRTPSDNDAIAFTSGTNIDQCLKLDFVRNSIGAFQKGARLSMGWFDMGPVFALDLTA